MQQEKLLVHSIPAIVWGRTSDKVFIHVHGKMSRKEDAAMFARIAEEKGYQTLSFDLPEHGERQDDARCDVWNGIRELRLIYDYASSRWREVSLFACSLGAYFSLQAFREDAFAKCLFQSPIVDMEYLVGRMMVWFGVSEALLEEKGEVDTPIDPLRWDYYQYIRSHLVDKWMSPTAILFGGRDDLQSGEVMEGFADRFSCRLTVAESCAHAFMDPGDGQIIADWLRKEL